MKCPSCGAESTGKFCNYCGCEMPRTAPENVSTDNSTHTTTVVNNYYQAPGHQSAPTYSQPIYTPATSPKSKTTALVLCILLGYFGIHQFYVGKTGMGVLYLFTMGLFGFGWIIDIILIATGKFKDSRNLPLVN
ncbi:MAG: TM2 domain-containing protein [Lachnospiraceae bacterium]|nr:TM2 domain-containing protein [Lachnospiraceae bacterium]